VEDRSKGWRIEWDLWISGYVEFLCSRGFVLEDGYSLGGGGGDFYMTMANKLYRRKGRSLRIGYGIRIRIPRNDVALCKGVARKEQ